MLYFFIKFIYIVYLKTVNKISCYLIRVIAYNSIMSSYNPFLYHSVTYEKITTVNY